MVKRAPQTVAERVAAMAVLVLVAACAPAVTDRTAALKRPPRELAGWYGPARLFSYAAEVQPVLDRHCVGCHDYASPTSSEKARRAGRKLNLSGDKGLIFSHSYTNLMRRSPATYVRAEHEGDEKTPLVSSVGAGPVKIIPPYSWGSHRSRLVRMLRKGHNGAKLDRESFDRIVTWIDLNAPYYPSHPSYYAANTAGRSPLSHKDLRDHPRCDMPGFVPCEAHRRQLEFLARRRRVEARSREAIVKGRKVYDRGPGA